MTVGQEVGLGELTQWLLATSRRSGMTDERSQPELVETWHSRTATLHHFTWTRSGFPDVVVKIHREPSDAAVHFQSMEEVARGLRAAPSSDFAVVDPLALSRDLGAVLMPYVAGQCLSDLLVFGKWTSEKLRNDVLEIVTNCGALLARYHGREDVVTEDMSRVAHDRLRSRIERLLNQEVVLGDLTASGPVVKSYRDFHPGHIIMTEAGKVALIDPPIEIRYEYFYRDLAFFSYSLFMTLVDPRGLKISPMRAGHRDSLVGAFLDGYTATTGHPLTDDDRFFIDSWEAFYLTKMLRKARRRRSYVRWAYYYVVIQRRLRGLKRTVTRRLRHASS